MSRIVIVHVSCIDSSSYLTLLLLLLSLFLLHV